MSSKKWVLVFLVTVLVLAALLAALNLAVDPVSYTHLTLPTTERV